MFLGFFIFVMFAPALEDQVKKQKFDSQPQISYHSVQERKYCSKPKGGRTPAAFGAERIAQDV